MISTCNGMKCLTESRRFAVLQVHFFGEKLYLIPVLSFSG